jgi:CheY-like chemotaxis protein
VGGECLESESTILIVDDEEIVRETLGALLQSSEFVMEYAANGAEALQKADDVGLDMVMLDVMMPGMNGFEMCRRS